jgi:hypothetical protein
MGTMSVTGQLRRLIPARRLGREDDGAALLEFTVIFPFLLVLGFGIFEFSSMLYQYHLITGGVRDAGRFAAGLPIPAAVDQTETCDVDAPQSTPVGCAKLLAVTGQLAAVDAPKRVEWWDVDDITVTYPELDLPDLRGGKPHKVVVFTEVTYDDIGLLSALGIGDIPIATSHEERHYGVR